MNADTIKRRLQILQDLQEELNKVKENYTESLNNSSAMQRFQEAEARAKEELAELKVSVNEVKASASMVSMEQEMKDLRNEVKDTKDALSYELLEYYKESGQDSIEVDGNVLRIKFNAKLTK